MRKVRIRKVIALLLAAVMAFSLVIVVGATEVTDTPSRQTAALEVECTGVTDDGVATFKISIVAPASGVAALQFTLTPEGMTYKDKTLVDLASVFKPGIPGVQDGDYDFTLKGNVGKYMAYGGDANTLGRYLSGEVLLMTVRYQLDEGAESGTLDIGEFKACESGEKAISDDAYDFDAPASVVANRPATPTPSTPSTGIKGDVNGDGEVNSDDLTALARIVAGIASVSDSNNKDAADVTGDGYVNSDDLTKMAQYVAGIISSFEQE